MLDVGDGPELFRLVNLQLGSVPRGLGSGPHLPRRRVEAVTEQAFAEHVELELDEDPLEDLGVDRLALEVGERPGDRNVPFDGDELLREQGLLLVLLQHGAAFPSDLLQPPEEVLDRAELLDELGRRLLAYPRDAGNVVDRVPHQSEDVPHLVGRLDLPLLPHLGVAENFRAAAGTPGPVQVGALRDQLGEVLVRGHHVGRRPGRFGALCQGPDDVVGLPPRLADDGNAEALADPENERHRMSEIVRHGLALRLVLGVLLVAVGRARGVEDDGDVGRVVLVEDFQQRRGEHERRRGVDPRRGRRRVVDHGEVTAVGQRHAVEQVEGRALQFQAGQGGCLKGGGPHCCIGIGHRVKGGGR